MTGNPHTTVGGLAASIPEALPVFQKLGIDFCCGGKRPILDALAEKGVSAERFYGLLEAERNQKGNAQTADFSGMSPAVLSAYIEDTHHAYLRGALPEIDALLLAVLRAHGNNHGELFEAYRLFGRLKADLEQHLIKEETQLFPALVQAGEPQEQTRDLAAGIIAEHEAAGEVLEELGRVTGEYAVPEDACLSYQRVYALLPALVDDLHRHIHLENNILLKGLDVRPAGPEHG